MKKHLVVLIVGMLACATSAFATPISFDLDGSSLTSIDWTNHVVLPSFVIIFWPDSEPVINPNLENISFTLNDNESYSFDFFSIHCSGVGYGTFDSTIRLHFDNPDITAVFTDDFNSYFTYANLNLVYDIRWDDAVNFTLADGNRVRITLQEYASQTSAGIPIDGNIPIHATVTNLGIQDAQQPELPTVPEPSTLLLFGTGLGILWLGRTKRRRK